MAIWENDVQDNVMVGIGVGLETCIRDKDMDPKVLYHFGRRKTYSV